MALGSRHARRGVPRELLRSLGVAAWFVFLSFPLLAVKVDTVERTVRWRLGNMLWVGAGAFLLSLTWRRLLARRQPAGAAPSAAQAGAGAPLVRRARAALVAAAAAAALAFPWFFSAFQTSIMTSALIWVMLGLGLNIVVGLAGLLSLGYAAFFAVGAYTYALLNLHWGVGFWTALPLGGLLAAFFGALLGFPVLRLRGDYLAIVTLGFGEIVRLVLENWSAFSRGPGGIARIPRPGLFGMAMSLRDATVFTYYLMIALTLLTVFVVHRLQHSRIGRAWVALREDEAACEAMGVDTTRVKLAAFALGATWAGLAGVAFAAKTTFISPASFTFGESALVLAIVVLGGMGSIPGVVLGALVLVLLPEYLRAVAQYRMLVFGAVMVLTMVFRPQGLIRARRRSYEYRGGTA